VIAACPPRSSPSIDLRALQAVFTTGQPLPIGGGVRPAGWTRPAGPARRTGTDAGPGRAAGEARLDLSHGHKCYQLRALIEGISS